MTKKTIVVKFGTSTLTQGTPKLNSPHMMEIVRQIAQLHHDGFRAYPQQSHQNNYLLQ